MLKSKKNKKAIVIIFIVITSIVLLVLIAQFIIGNILENRLENSLSGREESRYKIDVGEVKVNLFTMTLILKDVSVTPDSVLLARLKLQKAKQKFAVKFSIPAIRIRNIGLIAFVTNKHVDVRNFVIKDAEIVLFTSEKSSTSKPKKKDTSANPFNIDSIVLPGLNGVDVSRFSFKNFSLNVININNNDTVFVAKKLNLILENIALIKNESDLSSFRLMLKDVDFHLSDERFHLPGGKYTLSFDEMNFNMKQALLVFKKLKIKPRYSPTRMADMSEYQYEIFNCEIKKAEIHSFHPVNIIRNSKYILSNVVINEMKLSIFKDKRRPFDTEKRPMLPQQLLKSLKQDLYIDSLIINESQLVYSEQHKKMEEPMVVTLGSLNAKVSNITSIFGSIVRGTVLSIKMRANLQKKIPMGVNIYFPMKSVADTFSFNGWLGNGDIKLFNSVVLPAIGVKFKSGNLDGIKFRAKANAVYAIGEMTMLYHDLDGIVVRNDMEETNKFMSWVANQVMIKNNPVKNKENRTEPMFFNRVMYKGLGNFLWKTIQSGITATIIPTMDKKVQNEIDATLGIDKKADRKRNREEKRRKREK